MSTPEIQSLFYLSPELDFSKFVWVWRKHNSGTRIWSDGEVPILVGPWSRWGKEEVPWVWCLCVSGSITVDPCSWNAALADCSTEWVHFNCKSTYRRSLTVSRWLQRKYVHWKKKWTSPNWGLQSYNGTLLLETHGRSSTPNLSPGQGGSVVTRVSCRIFSPPRLESVKRSKT